MTAKDKVDYSKRGFQVRREACRLAAQVMAGRPNDTPSPLIWSLSVFFEKYILEGAAKTQKDFGPKKAAKLKLVER